VIGFFSFKRSLNLILPVFLIFMAGLLMIFDASSGEIVDLASSKNLWSSFVRQLVWGGLATFCLLFVVKVGWETFFTHITTLYWIFVALLVFVFVPGLGVKVNGACRWVGVGPLHIQPSEFIKIILPAYFIRQCSTDPSIFQNFSSFAKLLAKVFIPVALIALEPNNGTAGVIALMIGVLTLVLGIPSRFWLMPLCLCAVGLVVFALSNSHVQYRLKTYLHPELDLKGKGHQPYQAKIAAGSGGIFGKGPAKSMQKLSYLPEAQNDYVAAIFAEEFGYLGIVVLISVYLWLLYEVMQIVSATEVSEAFCWGMSIFYLLAFQTFMNLGVVSGLLPSTGLNLPFFSQGGSSLVANLVGIGLIITMVSPSKNRVLA
jgi:cell division protein FtsW